MSYINLNIKLFKKKIKILIKKLKKQKLKTIKKAFEVDVFNIIIVFVITFLKKHVYKIYKL
jgi:hypothetical protein